MKFKKKPKRILCPECKTGQESYLIDKSSPTCPYLSCYNGYKCAYFVPLDNSKKKSIFQKVFSK